MFDYNNDKPFLLLDIDGVLNPYAIKPHKRPADYKTFYVNNKIKTGWVAIESKHDNFKARKDRKIGKNKDYIRVIYNTNHKILLHSLENSFNIVWTTAWNDYANSIFGEKIDVKYPVLFVDRDTAQYDFGVHWKTYSVIEAFKNNTDVSFVWLDDLDNKSYANNEKYLSKFLPNGTLYRVDPKIGLTEDIAKDVLTIIE